MNIEKQSIQKLLVRNNPDQIKNIPDDSWSSKLPPCVVGTAKYMFSLTNRDVKALSLLFIGLNVAFIWIKIGVDQEKLTPLDAATYLWLCGSVIVASSLVAYRGDSDEETKTLKNRIQEQQLQIASMQNNNEGA